MAEILTAKEIVLAHIAAIVYPAEDGLFYLASDFLGFDSGPGGDLEGFGTEQEAWDWMRAELEDGCEGGDCDAHNI
jgi:hypothetical protein